MTKENKDLTEELTTVLEEVATQEVAKPQKGELVTPISETDFMIGQRQYKLVYDHREGFDAEKLGERFSEVLARYDYIVGDWGYEQLRLKGFFTADDKKAQPEQRIDTLEDYLYEYCNFGCAYFVIQRVGNKREKTQNRKRRKKNHNNQAAAAHIAEKKTDVKKKAKPVLKKKSEKKPNTKTEIVTKSVKKEGKKGSFTIRKRED
ncbi:YutD family protein [Enterococcus canintestini]|uniref:Transcriptional regulator n=1 Tax=Enterococcus canintestini TaxID=317010 RepID=A0A267HUK8_9ENTE|nr:YutD family protein [Enterococcus canintestini]PAB01912.1 transcriptional regulator [Enterococcus canintestini]